MADQKNRRFVELGQSAFECKAASDKAQDEQKIQRVQQLVQQIAQPHQGIGQLDGLQLNEKTQANAKMI